MSASSDIEKLFDHFGGDANAYQEIGRENEARSARTRWPLLVTLDLTQPTIPAIGQRRELAREAPVQDVAPAVDHQDATPKDAASVTRAKAPLFTRSHRRDIPPVVVDTQPDAPRGAARFGVLETNDEAAARIDAAPSVTPHVPPQAAPVPPAMPPATIPTVAQFRTPTTPVTQPAAGVSSSTVTPRAGIPTLTPRATAPAPVFAPAPAPLWTQAPAPIPAPAWTQTPAPAHAYSTAPAASRPPASILGKLFAPEAHPAPPQPAAPADESAPLQSVFDRLRGTPTQTAAALAGAPRTTPPAVSNSWLVNGPRRS